MIARFSDAQTAKRVCAVSVPGGLARQYRVQCQQPGSQIWHVAGSYRTREEAEQAVESLRAQGLLARLIEYRFCPAAA